MKHKFKKNIELDALMVDAGMQQLGPVFAMQTGMSPNEYFQRTEWLSKQNFSYQELVTVRVLKLQDTRNILQNF